MNKINGTLFVVATPIGNLGDISFRAVEVLKAVSLIACEDTRHTRKLTSHYNISTPLTSYFAHNERRKIKPVIERLLQGDDVALVSDAGTPVISDPGYLLVKAAVDAGIRVVAVPGACAAVAAAVVSGLPLDRFIFEGFLPVKSGPRKKAIEQLYNLKKNTVIFYESPHRLLKCLTDLLEVCGDIDIVIVRQLTKIHEEALRVKVSEAIERFQKLHPKGEFVVLFRTDK